jgi:hypothetical protein
MILLDGKNNIALEERVSRIERTLSVLCTAHNMNTSLLSQIVTAIAGSSDNTPETPDNTPPKETDE